MKKIIVPTSIGILFFTGLWMYFLVQSSPSHMLIIEERNSGNTLWQKPINEDEWFRHEYIHSVEKSKVIEKFKLGPDGQMLAMESWTRSFGAGLPFEHKGEVERVDGYYVIRNIQDPLDELTMLPSHLQLHTFHFQEEEVILSEEPFRRNLITIKTSPLTMFERLTADQ
ncbi:hypothetical protein CR194_13560 [Salipaludibacillus keqinensis]|uniref:DUF1850 domain-containing protein n=1 Tax=Salipaludibacillus keqinensis TaxID=2045207 RepID=A0A323TJ16_9BACI|nr:DUF1850 domain-containing protein [Salipaludibacillus keqinensis]PYZ92683.1 hypothetical protein CR194_13560 [Salipaludibacillus keqinensis]